MFSATRRMFASRIAYLFAWMGAASLMGTPANAAAKEKGLRKLNYDGKPADSTALFTPLIVHNGVIYISGQGAHSREPEGNIAADIEMHTTKVLDNVKTLVEAGGGTMESILQLNVFLASIDSYAGMNKVYKTYFPNGGPARTTVAVAALPGQSLVEINCIAAVVRK
jgi:2-iminobutanoate/2-iminopropanoate deaminase